MQEVAEEAKKKSEAAHKKFFAEIRENIRQQRIEWRRKYNLTFDNE
ncbi:hypothetical protein [uncultured Bacteroides sp.]|nr:hypothetical protein [uncultured Bacteroides sp.]